ncbi:3-oxoacyl-ACP synthase [Salinibaculum salinum]|uniref:3-oxoacyl-ACP synthase n=1 Tax=Salinibaculum salinum TaxID=3131996 RepID=UPI0030EB2E11
MTVALTGYGLYRPPDRITGEEVAEQSGIPEDIVVEKMGIHEKRVCPPDEDHVTDMCVAAAERALADADVDPDELDLVLYHGSEYKDYVVWSAAANVAERVGAENAYATENHTLCASTPVAMRQTAAQLQTGDIEAALHVTASRENDLLDYTDEDASFMFNFGSGGAAYVLEAAPEAERVRARVRESAATTDGSFAEDVIMPAGGSKNPPESETIEAGVHTLTVSDPDAMKERMAPVSSRNFLSVADDALSKSGYDRSDVDFVATTHMKRSFHQSLLTEFEIDPQSSGYYLDEYGHVQSADQWLAIDGGRERGRLDSGDVVLFLAAGTGYTWAASVLEWDG